MALPDILFKGVPRRYTRGYTADAIRAVSPDRVVIPCVGAYALATTAVEAGIKPEQIEACDISLYSTAIGNLLSRQSWRLEAIGNFAWLNDYIRQNDDHDGVLLRQVAAVVVATRLCQYAAKRDSLFVRERIREVRDRADAYLAQAEESADNMRRRLGGLRYKAEDMWDLLARHKDDDEKTIILCNPPRYTGGYERMYEGLDAAFDWDQPNVSQFDEEQYERLVRYLDDAPRTLLYYATPVDDPTDPADQWLGPWQSVFAARPKTGRTAAINWIVTNKPMPKNVLHRSDVEVPVHAKYKLFKEGSITEQSRIEVVSETKEVANYYRDLFVHRLGLANAERHKVLLLDGKLAATVGLHLQNLRASGSMNGVAKLRFAFSVPHPDYPRLHKLTLMAVVSSWFYDDEMADIEPSPRAVQTTMLTPYPEAKTARGIFTLVDREYDKDLKMNKLTYYADVVQRSPEETLKEWLKRWGGRT